MKLYAAATVALFALAIIQTTPTAAEKQESEAESTDVAITEPPVKLVHVLNPGEREYLSPNLIGVQNIAMTFLPLSMNFVNIIDAYREIVNGIRYEIVLNAIDTREKDEDTICRLVILEKPWLTTQWGDKQRELVNSNCSDAADNALPLPHLDPEEHGRALNEKYVSNSIFNGGRRNELSDSEMARLEAQIMPIDASQNRRRSSSSSSSSSSGTTTVVAPTNEPAVAINANEAETAPETSPTTVTPPPPATPTVELNDNEKRWLDDFLSVGAFNFEKTIEQQRAEQKQQQQLEQEQGQKKLEEEEEQLEQGQQREELKEQQQEPLEQRQQQQVEAEEQQQEEQQQEEPQKQLEEEQEQQQEQEQEQAEQQHLPQAQEASS